MTLCGISLAKFDMTVEQPLLSLWLTSVFICALLQHPHKIRPQLTQFVRYDHLAITILRIVLEILLMVVLGAGVLFGDKWHDFSHDGLLNHLRHP